MLPSNIEANTGADGAVQHAVDAGANIQAHIRRRGFIRASDGIAALIRLLRESGRRHWQSENRRRGKKFRFEHVLPFSRVSTGDLEKDERGSEYLTAHIQKIVREICGKK
ncbi:MAG TPA: hypothetical protein VII48_07320 [Rhizomicrobium sp.]